MYVRRFFLPFLALGVVSTPLVLFNDKQPQLGGASFTLPGNSACHLFPKYGTLFSTNGTQAGNDTIQSQIIYANATETGNIVASRSTNGVTDQKCTKITGRTLSDFRFPTYDLHAMLLPAEDRFFVFEFSRSGGGLLLVNIAGRPPNTPDIPSSYGLIAHEVFVDGNLQNDIAFAINQPLIVAIHLYIFSVTQPFSYNLDLFQIDEV